MATVQISVSDVMAFNEGLPEADRFDLFTPDGMEAARVAYKSSLTGEDAKGPRKQREAKEYTVILLTRSLDAEGNLLQTWEKVGSGLAGVGQGRGPKDAIEDVGKLRAMKLATTGIEAHVLSLPTAEYLGTFAK